MAQFSVVYSGGFGGSTGTVGQVAVTASDVRVTFKAPVCSPRAMAIVLCSVLGGVVLLYTAISLLILFGAMPEMSVFHRHWGPLLFGTFASLDIGLLFGVLPLRRRSVVLGREEIIWSEGHLRELLLQTANRQIAVTMQTVADRQAVVAGLRQGTAVTRTIRFGRESLLDRSGLSQKAPVTVFVEDGVVNLAGTALPGLWRSLAASGVMVASIVLALVILFSRPDYLVSESVPRQGVLWSTVAALVCVAAGLLGMRAIARCKREKRTLPCSVLQGVEVINRFVTVLAPDGKLGERRYTLAIPSPEEASAFAERVRRADGAPIQARYQVVSDGSEQRGAWRYLSRVTPGQPDHPGHVLTEGEQIIFIGRSGLPHPWSIPLKILITLLAYPLLVQMVARGWLPSLLDTVERSLLVYGEAALLALLFIYLPVSAALVRMLPARVTVPRGAIVNVERLGRQLTLTFPYQRITFTTASDEDAGAMEAALSAQHS